MRQIETREEAQINHKNLAIKIKQIQNYIFSTSKSKIKHSRLTMESAMASNGNTVELAGTEDSQVLTQTRAKVGRLNNSLRNLKGQLTKEVNSCYKKIAYFKTLLSNNRLANSVVKTDFAQSILDCHTRCETRYQNLEKGLSDLRELEFE